MAMTAKHMFCTLAVSAAAAMLAACGQNAPTPKDPARPAPAPASTANEAARVVDSKTLLVKPAVDQPASVAAPASYPAVKPGETLSAETFLNRDDGRSNDSIASPVKSLEACMNIARERTYANDIGKIYPSKSLTSCIGEDGTARARFSCSRTATGDTACSPV